jgi:uncharacterized repeat protein (TIGR03803 family)
LVDLNGQMNGLFLSRSVAICVSVLLFSACGASQPPIGAPPRSSSTAQLPRADADYTVLYSFKAGGGVHPASGVIAGGKTLYGTTVYGGDESCVRGCGTVYAIAHTSQERLIYRFTRYTSDGHYPLAALTLVGGTLYGTTLAGGSGTNCYGGCGTVFSVSRSGKETVLYNFDDGFHDGALPDAPLLDVDGTLYGTTEAGGPWGDGTIFSISTTGTETVLHNFTGEADDGAGPSSQLVEIDGTLYGITPFGGAKNLGTVFSVTTSGSESVLYSFKGGTRDGALPRSLIAVNGMLFGTTTAGGSSATCEGGCGTLFEISTTGGKSIRILHSFAKSQGSNPGGLTTTGGMLYGVAYSGGDHYKGTLFEASLEGATRVLQNFGATSDGENPVGQLLVVDDTLYGTTWAGGSEGKGTVYTLKP